MSLIRSLVEPESSRKGRGKGKGNTIQETSGIAEADVNTIFRDGLDWHEFNRRCDVWLRSRGIATEASGSFIHQES